MTKSFYKDVLTVYKETTVTAAAADGEQQSQTQQQQVIKVSGRAFKIESVQGLDLFTIPDRTSVNTLIALVDPMKKNVTCIKMNFKPFW